MIHRFSLAFFLASVGCSPTRAHHVGDMGATDLARSSGSGDMTITGPIPTKIDVTPGDTTLDITDGDLTNATVSYDATATWEDGHTTEAICTWTVRDAALGSFKNAQFKASGDAGGTSQVVCTYQGVSGEATLHINLHNTDNTAAFDATTRAALLGATATDPDIAKLMYPYDGTVFPRGLGSPEMMWSGGTAADLYAITVSEPGMDYTYFFMGSSPQRQTLPHDAWTKLVQTTGRATVTLYRMKGGGGGPVYKTATQTWILSSAVLRGSIYYQHIPNHPGTTQDIAQITPGSNPNENFITETTGPPPTSHSCVACHSVSKDGSTIAASTDGFSSPWITYDITNPAAVSVLYDSKTNTSTFPGSGFQAISPDGSVIVWGQASSIGGGNSGPFKLADAHSGQTYEPSGLSVTGLGLYPSFSPDGKKIAMAQRNDSPGNPTDTNAFFIVRNTNLIVLDYNPTLKMFSNMKTIKRPTPARDANVYPVFTPDSQWIIYQNGDSSSARPSGSTWQSGGTDTTARSDLHLIKVDGTVDIRLDNLSAGLDSTELHRNYEPTFNPVASGGYFWVVFVSMRTYGSRLTNTGDFDQAHCTDSGVLWSDCRSKQLWVAAIDINPQAGVDPSHPPFWLPDQDLDGQNMRGSWAMDKCKTNGTSCEAGFECCSGVCKTYNQDVGGMMRTCDMPAPGECANEGDSCVSNADCYYGACVVGTCQPILQ